MKPAHPSFSALAGGIAFALLAGCAVGPNFSSPAAPNVNAYTSENLPGQTAESKIAGGEAQKFAVGQDIPAQWWTLFQSEPLNRLVQQALKANPDVQVAKSALQAAEENVAAGEGAFFPAVDAGFGANHRQVSGATGGGPAATSIFTLYNASVSVSYVPDLFGGTRRAVEALEAGADFERYQLEATTLILTGNVVTAAIQEASLRAQITATREIVDAEKEQLNTLQKQLKLGGIAKTDVLAQAALMANAEASLPLLEKQLGQTRHLLSVLAGDFPAQAPESEFRLETLKLPEELPVSLPSKLVEQRPDVKAAEANLHAASAEIGVATANMLPQLSLTAAYGANAGNIADLFSPGSIVWNLGANLLQPVFHGGELRHKRNAAEAQFDQAAAQYRSTVLTAFQNVADALRALQSDAEALKSQLGAERAARDSLDLARSQFKEGAISHLQLLNAEQAFQQSKIARVQAQARRYADTAALFQALGGGWWNRGGTANNSQGLTVTENEKTRSTQ